MKAPGEEIKLVRERLGCSQAVFGFLVGVTEPTLRRYEQEVIYPPNRVMESVKRIKRQLSKGAVTFEVRIIKKAAV